MSHIQYLNNVHFPINSTNTQPRKEKLRWHVPADWKDYSLRSLAHHPFTQTECRWQFALVTSSLAEWNEQEKNNPQPSKPQLAYPGKATPSGKWLLFSPFLPPRCQMSPFCLLLFLIPPPSLLLCGCLFPFVSINPQKVKKKKYHLILHLSDSTSWIYFFLNRCLTRAYINLRSELKFHATLQTNCTSLAASIRIFTPVKLDYCVSKAFFKSLFYLFLIYSLLCQFKSQTVIGFLY